MTGGVPKALPTAFSYRLRIDGIDRGGFQEATGLDTSQDPVEYRALDEGTPAQRVLPAPSDTPTIILRSGMLIDDAELWEWRTGFTRSKAASGAPRRDLYIVQRDSSGQTESRSWRVRGARPIKWTGQSMSASGKQVIVDALELAHEGVEPA